MICIALIIIGWLIPDARNICTRTRIRHFNFALSFYNSYNYFSRSVTPSAQWTQLALKKAKKKLRNEVFLWPHHSTLVIRMNEPKNNANLPGRLFKTSRLFLFRFIFFSEPDRTRYVRDTKYCIKPLDQVSSYTSWQPAHKNGGKILRSWGNWTNICPGDNPSCA